MIVTAEEQAKYESWVNDNFFLPIFKSKSGRYQIKNKLIVPSKEIQEQLAKHKEIIHESNS